MAKKSTSGSSTTSGLSATEVRALAKRHGITTSGKSTAGLRVAIGRKASKKSKPDKASKKSKPEKASKKSKPEKAKKAKKPKKGKGRGK